MNLQEFINKYNGKFVEYHSYGAGALNQCVDCANQYIYECLKLTPIIGTNAQDFPKRYKSGEFTYIPNTPTGQPTPGDLMIFKSADNVGHISIHTKNINLNLFTSFDQNYPTNSPCKLVNHNYTNVLGWLHPIKLVATTTTEDNMTCEDKAIYEHFGVKNFDELKVWKSTQEGYLEGERAKVKALEKKINAFVTADMKLESEISELKKTNTAQAINIKTLTDMEKVLRKEIEDLQNTVVSGDCTLKVILLKLWNKFKDIKLN